MATNKATIDTINIAARIVAKNEPRTAHMFDAEEPFGPWLFINDGYHPSGLLRRAYQAYKALVMRISQINPTPRHCILYLERDVGQYKLRLPAAIVVACSGEHATKRWVRGRP